MNHSITPHARLFCRLVRLGSTIVDDTKGGSIAQIVARHRLTCADCQVYFASIHQLETDLQQKSGHLAVSPSTGFEQRIMAGVRTAERSPRRTYRRSSAFSLAGLSAAMVVALGLYYQGMKPSHELTSKPVSAQDVTEVVDAAKVWTSGVWTTIKPSALALTETNPLQTELNSVYSDARSAVSFLEMNFLPVSPNSEKPSKGKAPTDSV